MFHDHLVAGPNEHLPGIDFICFVAHCPPLSSLAVLQYLCGSLSVCVLLRGLLSVCSSAHVGLSLSLAVSIFLLARLSVLIVLLPRTCMCVSALAPSCRGPFCRKSQGNTQLDKGHRAKMLLWMNTQK